MAQAGGSAVAAVAMVALTLAATFWGAQAARKSTTLNVGDDSGWSLPSVTNVNYTLWASAHTYQVGDKLCESLTGSLVEAGLPGNYQNSTDIEILKFEHIQ